MSHGEEHAGYFGEVDDYGGLTVRQEFGDIPTTEPILNMPADRAEELAYAILEAIDEDRNPEATTVIDEISKGAAVQQVTPRVPWPAVVRLTYGEPFRYTENSWPVDFVIRMEPSDDSEGTSTTDDPNPDDAAERVEEPDATEAEA